MFEVFSWAHLNLLCLGHAYVVVQGQLYNIMFASHVSTTNTRKIDSIVLHSPWEAKQSVLASCHMLVSFVDSFRVKRRNNVCKF